jgi:hypothetical protein
MNEGKGIVVEASPRLGATPEYAALAEELRNAGFEPTDRPPLEKRDALTIVPLVAIYLLDKLADEEISQLVAAVRAWAMERIRPLLRRRGAPSQTIPIYGPDGNVIREVVVPAEDEEALG